MNATIDDTPARHKAPSPEQVPHLRADDRCDRCGAQAFVVTRHSNGVLLWCAHHYSKSEKSLIGFLVRDDRALINRKPGGSAASK